MRKGKREDEGGRGTGTETLQVATDTASELSGRLADAAAASASWHCRFVKLRKWN
jgi:hypothetical protein